MHRVHTVPGASNGIKALVALNFAGLSYEEIDVDYSKLKTPEHLKKNPAGKAPVIEKPDGKFVWESNAILRYIARLDKSKGLYGRNDEEAALVDQWIDWFSANWEKDYYIAVFPHIGRVLNYTKENQKESLAKLLDAFKVLDNHLKLNTFLVGNRITIADINLATILQVAFRFVWDEKFRNKNLPNVTRWFEYLVNQEPFRKVYGRPVLCKKALDRSQFEEKTDAPTQKPVKK